MKLFRSLLLFSVATLAAFGQSIPNPIEATAAQVAAGTAGPPYVVTPRRLTGPGAPFARTDVGNTFTGNQVIGGNITFGTSGSILNGTTGSIGLTATGTNQSITLTPSGVANVQSTRPIVVTMSTPVFRLTNSGSGGSTWDAQVIGATGHYALSESGVAQWLTLTKTTGHLLLGGRTADVTGVLQTPATLSSVAYATNGALLAISAASITDTTSSGTVAVNAVNSFGIPTLLATSPTTYTVSATQYIAGPPVASTNVTQTAAYSQYIAAGSVRWGGYGAGAATFDSNGNITSVSDARYKNIVGPFTRGLPEIRKLDTMIFHWNALSGLNRDDLNAGFIAQNVRSAIPEAVFMNKDGFYTLADRPITAALVNAVKELDERPVADWWARSFALAALLLALRANLRKPA